MKFGTIIDDQLSLNPDDFRDPLTSPLVDTKHVQLSNKTQVKETIPVYF